MAKKTAKNNQWVSTSKSAAKDKELDPMDSSEMAEEILSTPKKNKSRKSK